MKMKALEWPQHYSHYKFMWIFLDSAWKLHVSPLSVVRSGRKLNPSEILWLTSLPARMKTIQSKMKALASQCGQGISPKYNGSYMLPWTPEFLNDLVQNLMQPFPSTQMLLQTKFDCDLPACLWDIHV